MKKIFAYILFLFLYTYTNGQDISKLDQKNGFKDINLGANIKKFIHKFDKEEDGKGIGYDIYSTKDSYEYIGYIPIEKVSIFVYKEKVHEIKVFIDLEMYEDVKKVLSKAYGELAEDACQEMSNEEEEQLIKICSWKGKQVMLWCSYTSMKEFKKTMIGFQNKVLIAQMKKELTQKAADDL